MALGLLRAAFLLYVAIAALYLAHVATLREAALRWAHRGLWLALAVHLAGGAAWAADLGPDRLTGTFGVLPLSALVLVAAFAFLDRRVPLPLLGAFVAPAAAVVLLLCCVLHPDVGPPPPRPAGLLRGLHVALAFLGAAALALASGVAVLYLLLERQLKSKRLGPGVTRLPSLETLDLIAYRCVTIGFPVYTAAIVLGGVWAARMAAGGWQPQYTLALLGWAAFGVLLQARLVAGWRGRRAALLTVAGFLAVLGVVLAYVLRGVGSP